ncbi:MAG: hypothetical protein LLF76_00860 [Planctomycetaceae bacterium]|nr:hypothetical protein [Planctomycetaceae bacterium]
MNEKMTSRQRLITALNHQPPDRVPLDLGGFQTGIHKKAYQDLLAHLGFQEDIQILDAVQQLARPSERVLERFHVDTRYVCSKGVEGFDWSIKQNWRSGRLWHDLTDEFGVVWSMPDDQQMYMDISHHPLERASLKDIEDYPFPNGGHPSRFEGLRQDVSQMRRNTPYALCTGIGGVVYEYCWYMRGLENWFMDTLQDQAFCEALLDRTLAYWMDYYTGFMKEIGDLVDVVMIGDDLAGQHGPLFRPEFYRAVVKPRQKRLVQHIKSLTKAKIWYHTCGGCKTYIPDLIDNGVDILNPIQTSADDMDPQALKSEFGKKVVFWGGGIDSQHVLPFGRPDEIKAHVRENMAVFKPGGGYVFNNIHNIQAGVPAANIVAMYDAAYEYGFYD